MVSAGEWVEVRAHAEIAQTLAPDGTFEGLPFMPEMARYCGARFRVRAPAHAACVEQSDPGRGSIRALSGCVVLEGLRCDGSFHGGCQLGCMILWKERWLRRVEGERRAEARGPGDAGPEGLPVMRAGDAGAYVCQGTELVRASVAGPPSRDVTQYARLVRDGTLSLPQLASMFRYVAESRVLYHARSLARACTRAAPAEELALRPGEAVRVRSRAEIVATLGDSWAHKGLKFSPCMFSFCGRRMRVDARVENIVLEATGRLRTLRNTVTLRDAFCARYRGCAREMPYLWREVWLERA